MGCNANRLLIALWPLTVKRVLISSLGAKAVTGVFVGLPNSHSSLDRLRDS
jgi:hypothetical protein